jgi:hypothetical protein
MRTWLRLAIVAQQASPSGPGQITVSLRRQQTGPSGQKKKPLSSSSLLPRGRHADGELHVALPPMLTPTSSVDLQRTVLIHPSLLASLSEVIHARCKLFHPRRIRAVVDSGIPEETSSRAIKLQAESQLKP